MLEQRDGDIFKQKDINLIIHCCNCFNTMGAGIARFIKDKFPEASEADQATKSGDKGKLGTVSFAKSGDMYIANLYAQYLMGSDKRQIDYEAMYKALCVVRDKVAKSGNKYVIGTPYLMGCDRAKGSWRIVSAMLEDVFGGEEFKVVICKLK